MKLRKGVLTTDEGVKFRLGDRVYVSQQYVKYQYCRKLTNIKDRAGVVTGIKIKPLKWSWDNEGCFDNYGEERIIEVAFYATLNPVDVPVYGLRHAKDDELFELVYDEGLKEAMKEQFYKNPEWFPRDEKGRFIKST